MSGGRSLPIALLCPSVCLPARLRPWSDVLSSLLTLCCKSTREAPQYWPVSMGTACLSRYERPACWPQDHCELLGDWRPPALPRQRWVSPILRVRMVQIKPEREGLTITDMTFPINNKQYEYEAVKTLSFFLVHFTATKQYIMRRIFIRQASPSKRAMGKVDWVVCLHQMRTAHAFVREMTTHFKLLFCQYKQGVLLSGVII